MADAYVIEIGDEAIGLVVREEQNTRQKGAFRFYASSKNFHHLDGRSFPSPQNAKRHVMEVSKRRLKPCDC